MYLVTDFVVILPTLMVHAGVDEVRESKKLGLLSIIGHSRKNGRICHSSADSLLFRTNKTTSTQTKNIFGNDNRIPMNSTDYPWRAIGKLSMGCTGALVGRDLVLTAAHCVIDPNTHLLLASPIYFYANMIDSMSNHQAWALYIWWGTSAPDNYRHKDWALLRLDKPLGDTQGWFGVQMLSIDEMNTVSGILVGYSADYRNGATAGIHFNCNITKKQVEWDFFLHNCDMTRGASGGPIFGYWDGQPYIYAINVADYRNGGDTSLQLSDYTDQNANIAVWSKEFIEKIVELKNS